MNPNQPSPSFNHRQLSASLVPSIPVLLLFHLRYLEAESRQKSFLLQLFSCMTPKEEWGLCHHNPPTKTNSNALISASIYSVFKIPWLFHKCFLYSWIRLGPRLVSSIGMGSVSLTSAGSLSPLFSPCIVFVEKLG